MRAIQADRYDGGKSRVEELIELSRPLLTEQELEVMIKWINDGPNGMEKAYLYFDAAVAMYTAAFQEKLLALRREKKEQQTGGTERKQREIGK